jgi:hypothetical protein
MEREMIGERSVPEEHGSSCEAVGKPKDEERVRLKCGETSGETSGKGDRNAPKCDREAAEMQLKHASEMQLKHASEMQLKWTAERQLD